MKQINIKPIPLSIFLTIACVFAPATGFAQADLLLSSETHVVLDMPETPPQQLNTDLCYGFSSRAALQQWVRKKTGLANATLSVLDVVGKSAGYIKEGGDAFDVLRSLQSNTSVASETCLPFQEYASTVNSGHRSYESRLSDLSNRACYSSSQIVVPSYRIKMIPTSVPLNQKNLVATLIRNVNANNPMVWHMCMDADQYGCKHGHSTLIIGYVLNRFRSGRASLEVILFDSQAGWENGTNGIKMSEEAFIANSLREPNPVQLDVNLGKLGYSTLLWLE